MNNKRKMKKKIVTPWSRTTDGPFEEVNFILDLLYI
jgi:hypothetical protein